MWGQIHQHLACKFYAHRSQKRIKYNHANSIFCDLGSARIKAVCKTLVKSTRVIYSFCCCCYCKILFNLCLWSKCLYIIIRFKICIYFFKVESFFHIFNFYSHSQILKGNERFASYTGLPFGIFNIEKRILNSLLVLDLNTELHGVDNYIFNIT